MRKRLIPLVASLILILHPALAEAARRLDRAAFRPRFTPQAFVLAGGRNGDGFLFALVIQKTSETFRFRTEVDQRTGEATLTSVPDGAGCNPGIETSFRLLDVKGLRTNSRNEVGRIAFLDLAHAFVSFRLRERPNPEPSTSPPSAPWKVAECRTD
jgi:hypothetical protein